MKNLISLLLFAIVLSSCSVYSINKGKLAIPEKESYQVVYKADMSEGLKAKISYTDSEDKQVKLKDVTGKWEQAVKLKKGTSTKIKIKAKGAKGQVDCKILVEDNVIAQQTLSNKKIIYNIGFSLP